MGYLDTTTPRWYKTWDGEWKRQTSTGAIRRRQKPAKAAANMRRRYSKTLKELQAMYGTKLDIQGWVNANMSYETYTREHFAQYPEAQLGRGHTMRANS